MIVLFAAVGVHRYNNFNDTQFVMFPIGCLLTVSGVAALALKFKQSATTEATPVEEGEDAPFTLEVADSVAQDTPDHSGGAMGASSPHWQRDDRHPGPHSACRWMMVDP